MVCANFAHTTQYGTMKDNTQTASMTMCPVKKRRLKALHSLAQGNALCSGKQDFEPCKGDIEGMQGLQPWIFLYPLRRALPYANELRPFRAENACKIKPIGRGA